MLPAFQQSFQLGDRFEILRAPGGLLELNKSLKLDASASRSEDFYFEAICQQALKSSTASNFAQQVKIADLGG